jgi:hypothetical protein
MLEQVEEMKVRRDIMDHKDSILTVKYQVLDIEG